AWKRERRRVRQQSRPGQCVSGDEGDSREEPDDKGSARRWYGRPRRSDLRCLHGESDVPTRLRAVSISAIRNRPVIAFSLQRNPVKRAEAILAERYAQSVMQ